MTGWIVGLVLGAIAWSLAAIRARLFRGVSRFDDGYAYRGWQTRIVFKPDSTSFCWRVHAYRPDGIHVGYSVDSGLAMCSTLWGARLEAFKIAKRLGRFGDAAIDVAAWKAARNADRESQ